MKILLANKFYYPRGGDCIYTIELVKLLKENGHEVAVFAQQHPDNLESEYSSYWPSEVDYSSKNLKNIKEALFRPFFSKEVSSKFKKLMADFKPDIVHLNNIHSQISPVIAQLSHKAGIPVFWTLHDYKLLCPSYSCLRDGKVCELCFTDKKNVLKHKCVKNIVGSGIAYVEAKKWNLKALEKYTTKFIAPSAFMKEKMVQGGATSEKISVVNNFIDDTKFISQENEKEDYALYFGRFSIEKGVETLLKAATESGIPIKLAGTGPLFDDLTEKYSADNIEYLGFQKWDSLKRYIQKAKLVVTPSEWNEVLGLVNLESFALGTPVLGAKIGGIPELISEGENGLLFESGNDKELAEKLIAMLGDSSYESQQHKIIADARAKFSSSSYYSKLLSMYKTEIKG